MLDSFHSGCRECPKANPLKDQLLKLRTPLYTDGETGLDFELFAVFSGIFGHSLAITESKTIAYARLYVVIY